MGKRYPKVNSRGELEISSHSGDARWIEGTVGGSEIMTRPSDTTNYTLGDEISNDVDAADALPWVFPDFALENGGRGFIRQAFIISSNNIAFAPYLWIYNAPPTMVGDNVPFSHVLADDKKLVHAGLSSMISIPAVGARSISPVLPAFTMKCADDSTDLYGVLVAPAYVPLNGQTFRIRMLVEY